LEHKSRDPRELRNEFYIPISDPDVNAWRFISNWRDSRLSKPRCYVPSVYLIAHLSSRPGSLVKIF